MNCKNLQLMTSMLANKEIIKKLFKIAENQNKIIAKIAQFVPDAAWSDVNSFITAFKLILKKLFPNMTITDFKISNFETSTPALIITAQGVPSPKEVNTAINSQLQLKGKIPSSVKINGVEFHQI